jgi:OOP family OmpA-OmpF porin
MKNKNLVLILITVALPACASSKRQSLLEAVHSPLAQSRPATFEAVRDDLATAEREHVNLISPAEYAGAKHAFDAAAVFRQRGDSEDKVNGQLEKAREELDEGFAFANANRDRLMPLIEVRNETLKSDAAEVNQNDLAKTEREYIGLVTSLHRARNAQDRDDLYNQVPKLVQRYRQLTARSAEKKYLGEAMATVELAKKEGAEKLTPKTLRQTEELIQKDRAFLANDQQSAEMFAELSDSANFAAKRLLALTRQARSVREASPEDIALKTEGLLASAAAGSDMKDARDQSFESQASQIHQEILSLKKDHERLVAQSTQLQEGLSDSTSRIADLKNKAQKADTLEKQAEKDKNFEAVRELFNEDEAKVYRQGDSLVISLKKIKFPVNKSEIPSESFPLLKKVQKAIRSFPSPSVVIEGHTDSTGSAERNKELSEKRAMTVKDYLLSNDVVGSEKVVALGYGAEKPLASNKSPAGRAINRRIDIIIKD